VDVRALADGLETADAELTPRHSPCIYRRVSDPQSRRVEPCRSRGAPNTPRRELTSGPESRSDLTLGGRLLDTLSALTGPAAVVAANLTTAQIAATADGLDAPLLVGHPRLARAVASNLRGVSGAPGRAGQAYFRAADEVDAAERVARWRKEVAQRGSGGRSPLSLRLGAVCSDLLCSDEACHAAALRKCNEVTQHAGKAQWTGEVVDRQRAVRCREWLNALPKAQRPVCDGVLGECIVPDPPP